MNAQVTNTARVLSANSVADEATQQVAVCEEQLTQDGDDGIWFDADVSTKLNTPPRLRRPNVVCDQPSKLTEDQQTERRWIQRSKMPMSRRMVRRREAFARKVSPPATCSYTKLRQPDCWCLHKVHAKGCDYCSAVTAGDDICIDCRNNAYDMFGRGTEDQMEKEFETLSIGSIPKEVDLIYCYFRDVYADLVEMKFLWTYGNREKIMKLCEESRDLVALTAVLIRSSNPWSPARGEPRRSLPQQKEIMFVRTDNVIQRMKACNKIVNDTAGLHQYRADFLKNSNVIVLNMRAIRSFVNEAGELPKRKGAIEQMEQNGDSNMALPQVRPSTTVGFTRDKARDETAHFALGHKNDILDVVERCKIPSRLHTVTYDVNSVSGTPLARYRVSPAYCPEFTDVAGKRVYSQTTLCNYANMYHFWKGSIVYTIEAVRTPFHMGQILIAFSPTGQENLGMPAAANLIYKVMDLSESNRLEFKVDYVAETEYRKCVLNQVGPDTVASPYSWRVNVGVVHIFALTPLSAPSTVAPAVELNVYVHAGDDFTFKAPTFKTIGLEYFNLRRGAYEQMETEYATEVSPVNAQPPQGMSHGARRFEIARSAKLPTASTHSVAERKYILRTNIEWDSNDSLAAPLVTLPLPQEVLTAANLSLHGLVSYHEFFRGTFKIVWELNAPLQYAGLLIMFYAPSDLRVNDCSPGTWTQLPHVFFNPANETIAELEIPWTYVTPMANVDNSGSARTMGRVYIYPWNGLKVPVGAANTLVGAISVCMREPHFSVKRPVRTYIAQEQMEQPVGGGSVDIKTTSASAEETARGVDVFGGAKSQTGIMSDRHTNVLDLLRRVDFADNYYVTPPVNQPRWVNVARMPTFFGPTHNFIRNGYAFSNGSNIITFVMPVGSQQNLVANCMVSYYETDYSDNITTSPLLPLSSQVAYQGIGVWKPGLTFEHSVRIPYYHSDPVISVLALDTFHSEYANVLLNIVDEDTDRIYFSLGHTVDDDFRLYFPVPFGKFRTNVPNQERIPTNEVRENIYQVGQVTAPFSDPSKFQKRFLSDVCKEEESYPPDKRSVLPAAERAVRAGKDTLNSIYNHLTANGVPLDEITDIGWDFLKKKGHTALVNALNGYLQQYVPNRTRRSTEVAHYHGEFWPKNLPLLWKKEGEGYVRDYQNVFFAFEGEVPDDYMNIEDVKCSVGPIKQTVVSNADRRIDPPTPAPGTALVIPTPIAAVEQMERPEPKVRGRYNSERASKCNHDFPDCEGCDCWFDEPTVSEIREARRAKADSEKEKRANKSFTEGGLWCFVECGRCHFFAKRHAKKKRRAVEQMERSDEEDDEEAEMLASSFCAKIASAGSSAMAIFCEAFRSIQDWMSRKCRRAVTQRTCDKIKEKLMESVDNVLDKILPVIIWMVDFVSNLYVLFNTESSVMRGLMLTSITAKSILAYREGTQLVEKLEELFGVTEQAEFDEKLPMVSALVSTAMVAGVLGILGYSMTRSDSNDVRKLATWKFAESCAMLAKIGGAVKAVPTLWSAANTGITTAVQFFVEGPSVFKNWESKNHEKLIQWQRDYDEGVRENLFVNEGLYKYKGGLTNYERLLAMATFATEVKIHGPSIRYFNTVWLRTAESVTKIAATATKSVKAAAGRSEPVGIIVQGSPGCGKSLLFSQFLPHAVLTELGLTNSYAESREQTYAKPTDPNADFWDGYLGSQHKWVNIDDFGQSRAEADVGTIYNLISSSDAPVNMAELADKGTLFSSDFVCCTTNLKNFSTLVTIRSPLALARRFPIALQCDVKDRFKKKKDGTLDHAAMIAHLRAGKSTSTEVLYRRMNDVWVFTDYDFYHGKAKGEVTVAEVVQQIVGAYQSRKKGKNDFDDIMVAMCKGDDETGSAVGGTQSTSRLVREQMENDSDDEYAESSWDGVADVDQILQCPFSRWGKVEQLSVANPHYNPEGPRLPRYFESDITVDDMREIHEARTNFVARTLDGVGGWDSWGKMTHEQANRLLDEVRYCLEDYGITEGEYLAAKDKPGYILRDNSFTKETFLVVVARLRDVNEDKTDGPAPRKWLGLAAYLLKWMGVVAVGAVAVGLIVKLVSLLFKTVMKPLAEEQGPQYEGVKAAKGKAPAKMGVKPMGGIVNVQGPVADERHIAIENNMREVRLVNAASEIRRKVKGVALDSNYIVIPEHWYQELLRVRREEDPTARFEMDIRRRGIPSGEYVPIDVGPNNSIQLEGAGDIVGQKLDARLIYLYGQPCTGARAIWGHVMKLHDLALYAQTVQWGLMLGHQRGDEPNKVLVDCKDYYTHNGRVHMTARAATLSKNGDCGRPYVHYSKHAQRTFMGFHTLGLIGEVNNVGFCPIVAESLETARNALRVAYEPPIHVEPLVVEEMEGATLDAIPPVLESYWHTPTMPLLGTLSIWGEEIKRYTPLNTKYLPIDVGGVRFAHPEWVSNFCPSAKRAVEFAGEVRHPLFTGAQKYERVARRVAPMRFTTAAISHFNSRMPQDMGARALTDDEALNGYETMGHLVMSTGPGYWGIWFAEGKKEIFSAREQRQREDGSVEELDYTWSDKAHSFVIPIWKRTIVDFYHDADRDIQEGKPMKTFWVSTLKDELVTAEKARIGKTRVFEQPCVVYTLLCRKYFGYFSEVYKKHAGARLHHGIGKDADTVWGRYFEILTSHGENGFDVDYRNYDGTVQPAAFEFFLQVTDYFYGLENRNARHALIRCLQQSQHIIGGVVAESTQGNKSGNPLTDVFNSVTNTWMVYVCYQWSRVAAGLDAGLETQPENFEFLTYGDDVIIGASDDCLVYFNRVTFAQIAALQGMTVTAANKSAEITPFENLRDLTFLKRPFVQRVGYVAAPLPVSVIYRELTWQTKACVGHQTIFEERIKTALGHMAHHGREAYQKLRAQLRELGVKTEDRFLEWEVEMREKQENAEVEDSVGRVVVDASDVFLFDASALAISHTDFDYDWLHAEE